MLPASLFYAHSCWLWRRFGIMTFTDLAGMVNKGPLFSGMQKVRDHDIR